MHSVIIYLASAVPYINPSLQGTSGKGLAVIGTLAKRLIDGPLVPVPMVDDQYFVRADVTLNNKVVAADQLIYMDVGTNNIQGCVKDISPVCADILTHTMQTDWRHQEYLQETRIPQRAQKRAEPA